MFKAIGYVIVLYAISQMMAQPFDSFKNALSATFQTIEVAANVSKNQLVKAEK